MYDNVFINANCVMLDSFDISIGNRVAVGPNVVFLPGVTIGEGSAIGAGCVINKDIPAHSIVKRNNNFLITIEKIRS